MAKITPSTSRFYTDVVQLIGIIVFVIIVMAVIAWVYSREYGCSNCGKVSHPTDTYCSMCGKQLRIK